MKEYFPRAIAFRDGTAIRPRPQQSAAYQWGLERFLSEARALQQVRHPALVAVLGVTQHGGTAYVGMSYEQGREFGIWLHEQKRIAPQDELDKIRAPLLRGLALAHASNVFHFDLGPDCIIIRENGTPVIVDFGVFRVGLRRRLPPGDIKAQTYAAPELLATAGGPIGPWTDIYSLAGLLYLAVTGKPPLSAVERARGATLRAGRERRRRPLPRDFLARDRCRSDARARPAATLDCRLVQAAAAPQRQTLHGSPGGPRSRRPRVAAAAIPTPAREPAEPPLLGTGEALSSAAAPKHRAGSAGTRPARGRASPVKLISWRCWSCWRWRDRRVGRRALAAILRADCTGENCAGPLMLPLAAIGAAVGLYEAIRTARRSAASAASSPYEL